MEIVAVELFTPPGNNAIVRMPGRAFPGVLVQGDSLSIVREHVASAARLLASLNGGEEALGELGIALDDLDAMLDGYERALEANGLRRPYAARQPRTHEQ
jgi:hypothetical protein